MNDKGTFDVFYKDSSHTNEQPGVCLISHNVFWFQGVPFATDTPPAPRPEIASQLCSLFSKMSPDVICLQELQSHATAEMVAGELGMKYIFRSGGSYPQYGGAVFSRWPMEEIASLHDVVPDRILIQVRISPNNAEPFCVVNTHLPSNRQRGLEDSQKRRLQELSSVLGQADILLGDFNERPGGQCSALLQKKRFMDTAQACGAGESASNIGGRRGDQIWIAKNKTDRLRGYFVAPKEQLAISDGETKFLSDHLPIGCLLR